MRLVEWNEYGGKKPCVSWSYGNLSLMQFFFYLGCFAGQIMKDGECTCPHGKVFMWNECACPGKGQIIINSTCVCPKDQILVDNVCTDKTG